MQREADAPGRSKGAPGAPAARPSRRAAADDRGRGRRLVCVACKRAITDTAARIEVDGLHEHSQVNPHGYVWTFGCFAEAPGCAAVGSPSTEFTWFPGHAWRVAQCRRCGVHLGWEFRSDARGFHGIIVGRLEEEEDR